MTLGEIEAAAKLNPALRRMLQDVQKWMTSIEDHLGFAPQSPSQSITRQVKPPALAGLVVTGADGHYLIQITNPSGGAGQILHEIRAVTTVPVMTALDVIVRGPSPDQIIDILDPDTTRYFQLKSKYARSEYNQPQLYAAVSSGPRI